MNKNAYSNYVIANNKDKSGKASSYIKELDLLCLMLEKEPLGFSDCVNIWEVDSAKRINELYKIASDQSKLGEKSPWFLPEQSSYLSSGFCTAALKSYGDFLMQFDVAVPWSSLAEKYLYDKAYRNQAVEMLGQKLNTTLSCSARSRIVTDGIGKLRAACMLSLTSPFKFFCPPEIERDLLENGEENFILLVIDHPASVFAIPVSELRDNLNRIPLYKKRRAYFVEKKEEQFFIKMDENEQFPINEFLLGKCTVPEIDPKISKDGLGHPFDKTFNDLDEANMVLDLFRKSILLLQDDEQERVGQLVLSISKQGKAYKLTLNFGHWAVLRFQYNLGWQLALPTPFAEKITGKKLDSFSTGIDGVQHSFCLFDDPEFDISEVLDEYEKTVPKIAEKYSDWDSSPYKGSHQPVLYEASMSPEKRETILRKGLSGETNLGQTSKTLWLLAPGRGAKKWETYQSEGIASIGWNDTGDLQSFGDKKSIRDALEEHYPDNSSSQVGRMLHDFVK